MTRWIARDEREAAVDAAADRLSYLVVSFGLLAAVALRSLLAHEASWDLLALVVVGGLAGAAVRARQRVVDRRWLLIATATVAIATVVAAVVAVVAVRP